MTRVKSKAQTKQQTIAKKYKKMIEEVTTVLVAYMDGYASAHDKASQRAVGEKYPQLKGKYEPDPQRVAKYYDLDRLDSLFHSTADGASVLDSVADMIEVAADGRDEIREEIEDEIKAKLQEAFGIADMVMIVPGVR